MEPPLSGNQVDSLAPPTADSLSAEGDAGLRPQQRSLVKRPSFWIWTVALTAVVVFWAALPWTWSLIDDPGMRIALLDSIHSHGIVMGILDRITDVGSLDYTWGLFRPLYWVFAGLFYLLPVGPAHALRLAMILVAVLLPVYAARRLGTPWSACLWGLALLAADRSLYSGLSYLSLQELSGAVLVSIGFAINRPWARILLFVGAAWFKAPFVWLAVAYSTLTIRKHRAPAIVGLLLSVVTVTAGALYASRGDYTTRLAIPTSADLQSLVMTAGKQTALVVVILLVGLALFKVDRQYRPSPLTISLAFGAIAYFGTFIFWNAGNYYYYGGPVHLLGLTGLSAVMDAQRQGRLHPRFRLRAVMAVGLAACCVASLIVVAAAVRKTFSLDQSIRESISWSNQLPAGSVIGMSDPEGAVRLNQIRELDGLPSGPSTTHFVFVPLTDTKPATPYYLALVEGGADPTWPHQTTLQTAWLTGFAVQQ